MKLSEIIDVQDHRLNTDYYATMILKTMQDGKKCEAKLCRMVRNVRQNYAGW